MLPNRYLQKLESFQEDETSKILCDFEIQTDQITTAKRKELALINKKKRMKNLP